jgi:NitT/TauT family transport system substrate-binding protein
MSLQLNAARQAGCSLKMIVASASFAFIIIVSGTSFAQTALKKVRMALPSSHIGYLAFYAALEKGFYRQEGIDLELIVMPANLASTAVLSGDLDYNAAISGVITAQIQGRPMRALMFTTARPLMFFISKKELKDPVQLKGKKVAGSSPGAVATMLSRLVLSKVGLDPDRDVELNPMGGTGAGRFAALESGVVDAAVLELPYNIVAQQKDYNELIFLGDFAEFPQNGLGTSEKKIRENPDEVYKMVRATLRGLAFIWEKQNYDDILNIVMRQWKIGNREMAGEMFRHLTRVLTRDASVKTESVQFLVDMVRENAKVTRPVTVAEIADFRFVEKARKEIMASR